ncbi:hypothetical protein [Pseudokineococcus sp. 1T1Z-3]|uniref:hypothetical protein n=1 Tax=Pseudokineococcus sp. 1T1Z-3 TaxID=3132745 RepID=UPI0030A3CCF2
MRTVAADFDDPGFFSTDLADARQLSLCADLNQLEGLLEVVVAAGWSTWSCCRPRR